MVVGNNNLSEIRHLVIAARPLLLTFLGIPNNKNQNESTLPVMNDCVVFFLVFYLQSFRYISGKFKLIKSLTFTFFITNNHFLRTFIIISVRIKKEISLFVNDNKYLLKTIFLKKDRKKGSL